MKKTSKRFKGGVIAVAALAAAMGSWRAVVWAQLNLSDSIHVEIEDTSGISLQVYTPDAQIPATLPVGILTEVRPEVTRGATVDDVSSVVTALGGALNMGTGEITGELEKKTATLVNVIGDISEYIAVIDLKNLEYGALRGSSDKFASDMIRSVAIASSYYSSRTVSDIVEGDQIPIEVSIFDAATIDGDGNGIPDADALLGGDRTLISEDGTVTIIRSLNGVGRGVVTETEVSHFYDTANGPVEVTLTSPILAALQTADDAFDVFDTGRLIVTIGTNTVDLLDGPAGVSPLSEFDLVDGTDPLPAPQNLFVRVAIAVATTAPRGEPTAWTFIQGDLPGGLDFVGSMSGPGIANALQDGTDVGVYTYEVTLSQSGQNILANGDEDGWTEADSVQVNNDDSADAAADARIVVADDGDDTIRAVFSEGSAIFGSNVAPRATDGDGGGDSGSFCFIATAAYGTPLAREIGSLRSVRDTYMIGNPLGAAFVDTYYRLSPPIAGAVSENAAVRLGVRIALAPIVAISGWLLASPGSFAAVGIAAMLLCASAATRSVRRVKRHTTRS